jgi:alpha-beta hydrolase superfamily lysophospholipase
MTVKAFFRAAKVESAKPPYDTIHLKIFYPAKMSDSAEERNFGVVPANSELAPFPAVIFFNGVNCGIEIYQWLAAELAKRGIVVLTFSWVSENIPGMVAISPGVELAMLAPNAYGTGPTASALPALLAELERLQSEGILAGMLDLERVILGGHSAGGRVAIESCDRRFFPQLAGAFAYGAHTAAGTTMGYEAGTILPLPDSLPLLLMGGTRDGVIANSSDRYGIVWDEPTTPIVRTFQEGIKGNRNDSYLVLLEGANHFSIAYPFDTTAGTSFLDFPPTQPEGDIRSLMAEAIGLFIETTISKKSDKLEELLNAANPLIKSWQRK